ncbi:MAG: hypothetical protein ACK5PS_08585 [Desulfopila sp.]
MSSWGYPKYVTAAEKKARAEKKLKQLKKKMPGIEPVILEGSVLARNWWGKSWNRNLERYADYSNRIGRGKSYVRHGAVLDLKIEGGRVTALVQGTRARPYEVVINIVPVKKANWDQIRKQCQGELRSLTDLVAGKFPKELGEIFLTEGKGLFPTPKEISFACSCPDWASMCKHVAAALYGVGARLDEDPLLFFTLRQADTEELVTQAVQEKTGDLLARASQKSSRVLGDADLSGLFGIDMDIKPEFASTAKVAKDAKCKKTRRGKKELSASAPRQVPTVKTARSATALIEEIVGQHPNGVTVAMLEEATGFQRSKIYAITSRLRQEGRISSVAHGVYGRP